MSRLNPGARALVALAAAFVASAPAMAQNLIVNGHFDGNYNFAGWTVTSTNAATYIGWGPAPDGNGNALYVKDAPLTLSQTFSDTAGKTLTISADYLLQHVWSPGSDPFSVLYDGKQIFSTTTQTNGWDTLGLNVEATGDDTLTFDFDTHGVGGSTPMELADVSVEVSAVPEPAPMLMAGLGLAALLFARRRLDGSPAQPAPAI